MAVYTYEIEDLGFEQQIIVYEDYVKIYTGEPSMSASVDILIEEAILGLQGTYPGVENMTLKGEAETVIVEEVTVETVETTVDESDIAPEDEIELTEPTTSTTSTTSATTPIRTIYPPVKENAPVTTSETVDDNKTRIYQIFEPTIVLDELSIPSEDMPGNQKQEALHSLQYPLIKINDYIVNKPEIDSMTIDCTEFLPKITLQCTFLHRTFISQQMPKDGDIISIAIRNKSNLLKLLRNDYVITAVVSKKNTTDGLAATTMTFFGVLFVPWVSSSKFNISYEGTSFDAMKNLAKDMGLGFATNEENTDDKQIWISGYTTVGDYIEETVLRSYKDAQSFYDVWIDVYYNLNFINLNKQLMSQETETDLAVVLNSVDKDFTFGSEEDDTRETAKVLSNYDMFKTSSFYIDTWRPINRSTTVTYQVGTKINCHLFEHNQNLFDDPSTKKYWKIPLEPTYDPDKVDKFILLRGRATQDTVNRGDELARANYSYPEIYVQNPWMGVQYTVSNSDDNPNQWNGNHHKNYLRARLQNVINKKELEKLNIEVSVTGMNLNIIKGDKIPIILIEKDRVENQIINPESEGLDLLQQFYSGWYLVKGFNLKYTEANDNSIMSNFTQTFVLTRREWPPPVAVESIQQNNIT